MWHNLLFVSQCDITTDWCHNGSWTILNIAKWHNDIMGRGNTMLTSNITLWHNHWLLLQCNHDLWWMSQCYIIVTPWICMEKCWMHFITLGMEKRICACRTPTRFRKKEIIYLYEPFWWLPKLKEQVPNVNLVRLL